MLVDLDAHAAVIDHVGDSLVEEELVAELAVPHHARCPWAGLRWATMRGIIEQHAPSSVMLIRFDAAEPDPPLARAVAQFDPPKALYAGADGLDAYRAILPGAARLLRPGGTLILEIGAG